MTVLCKVEYQRLNTRRTFQIEHVTVTLMNNITQWELLVINNELCKEPEKISVFLKRIFENVKYSWVMLLSFKSLELNLKSIKNLPIL